MSCIVLFYVLLYCMCIVLCIVCGLSLHCTALKVEANVLVNWVWFMCLAPKGQHPIYLACSPGLLYTWETRVVCWLEYQYLLCLLWQFVRLFTRKNFLELTVHLLQVQVLVAWRQIREKEVCLKCSLCRTHIRKKFQLGFHMWCPQNYWHFQTTRSTTTSPAVRTDLLLAGNSSSSYLLCGHYIWKFPYGVTCIQHWGHCRCCEKYSTGEFQIPLPPKGLRDWQLGWRDCECVLLTNGGNIVNWWSMDWVFEEYRHISDKRVLAENEIKDFEEAWFVKERKNKNKVQT